MNIILTMILTISAQTSAYANAYAVLHECYANPKDSPQVSATVRVEPVGFTLMIFEGARRDLYEVVQKTEKDPYNIGYVGTAAGVSVPREHRIDRRQGYSGLLWLEGGSRILALYCPPERAF